MSRPIIFNVKNNKMYKSKEIELEKNLQKIIEENMETLVDYIIEKIISIDEDVTFNELSRYGSLKTVRPFASIVLQNKNIKLYLHLNYDENRFKNYRFIEDVARKGHWGTGNVLIKISNQEKFDKIFNFIIEAYENN